MSKEAPVVIEIDQDWFFGWLFPGLIGTAVALVLLDAFISEFELISVGAAQRLFNITREDGIPNFFSSFQMLTVGVVLLLITLVTKAQSGGAHPRTVAGWGLTTGLFVYTGIDDATKLHERVGSIFEAIVTDSSGEPTVGPLGGLLDAFPSYPWQFVFGPFIVVLGVFLIAFLMRELPLLRFKVLVLLALTLFVTAVAMDFVEGIDSDPLDEVADVLSMTPGRVVHFSKSIEELVESQEVV